MSGIIFTLKTNKNVAYNLAKVLKNCKEETIKIMGRCMEKMALNSETTDEESMLRFVVNKTGEFEKEKEEDTTCPECGEEMEQIYKCFECGYSYDD